MARRIIRLAVGANLRSEFRKRAVTGIDEDRQSALPDGGIGVRAGGSYPDRRMGSLQRPRRHGDVLERVVFAFVGETRLGPGQLDDVQDLGEAVAAFRI